MRILCVFVVAVCFACSAANLRAEIVVFLNGGIASRVDPNGNNIGEPAEFDSFITPNLRFTLNSENEPVALVGGLNVITVEGIPSTFGGLGLFFTTVDVLLDDSTDFARSPNLNVFRTNAPPPVSFLGISAAAPEFAIPVAGTPVATLGQFSGNAPYSGAEFFDIGGQRISIADWNGSSLSLSVVAVPEPSSLAIIAAGVTSVVYRRMKRHKNNQTAI